MTNAAIRDKLIAQLGKLPYDLQLRVVNFATSLIPKGITGKNLLKFERAIPADKLQLMSKSIEESCEKVDSSEW
ncbi:MAG TPA: hypothetical protein DCP92_01525 [Nitrospiraceae bacterium]|nr:hypothetical protein [Nitrospiraceae bacterium]